MKDENSRRVEGAGQGLYKFYLDITDGEYGHLDGPNYVVAESLEAATAYARSWAAGFYSDVEWNVHLIGECNDIGAPRADWGKDVVFRLVREDLVEDIEARLTMADESYDRYVEERDAEGWDSYQLGYIAGLELLDSFRRRYRGTGGLPLRARPGRLAPGLPRRGA